MKTPVRAGIWTPMRLGPKGPEPAGFLEVRWRDLTLEEHRSFRLRREHPRILFCEIYEKCLVSGPPLDQAPAGIVSWIAKQQLEANPFNGEYASLRLALNQARQRVAASWFHAARAVLASSFRYSFEEIDRWPPEVFFERVAQAEMLTGVPLEPADPEQEQRQPGGRRNVRQAPGQKSPAPPPGIASGNVDRRPQLEVEQNSWAGGRRR